ncbi:MAG: putative short-subunit dehydrogenase-like oxidoreductase (DUF2520 family) [Bacteroidia bacterium]|jgi:predicted short-subunit dehydrogenase-like oxidoreductase (DUF2520 family)
MNLKIGFIGSGNVARHLSRALNAIGHNVVQIISKTSKNAEALAADFDCAHSNKVKSILDDVELCIICVSDNQIEAVIKQLPESDRIVVHTCGSVAMDVLKPSSKNIGVFYPLQSFSKDREPDMTTVPFLLESSNPETLIILHQIANAISHYVLSADSETRLKYHLSAVFVNNFVNHLYTEASLYLEDNDLDFNVLKPIIKETALKIQNHPPKLAQTGPAKRGDQVTLDKHLELLKQDKSLAKLYKELSAAIALKHKK